MYDYIYYAPSRKMPNLEQSYFKFGAAMGLPSFAAPVVTVACKTGFPFVCGPKDFHLAPDQDQPVNLAKYG
jgi:hypothetical protein